MHTQQSITTPLGDVLMAAQSNGDVSLATGALPHAITNGMTIDSSTVCVVTVKPTVEPTSVVFSAKLTNTDIVGHSATGEHLDCIEFENSDWHLTIGTEDLAMLHTRMPTLTIPVDPYPVAYDRSGMELQLDRIAMTRSATFHFAISYKKLPDERECSAWFFADIPHALAIEATRDT